MATGRRRATCRIPTKPYTVASQDPGADCPVCMSATKSERVASELFDALVEAEVAAKGIGGTWTVRLYGHTPATRVSSTVSPASVTEAGRGKPYLLAVDFPGSRIIRESNPETRTGAGTHQT